MSLRPRRGNELTRRVLREMDFDCVLFGCATFAGYVRLLGSFQGFLHGLVADSIKNNELASSTLRPPRRSSFR